MRSWSRWLTQRTSASEPISTPSWPCFNALRWKKTLPRWSTISVSNNKKIVEEHETKKRKKKNYYYIIMMTIMALMTNSSGFFYFIFFLGKVKMSSSSTSWLGKRFFFLLLLLLNFERCQSSKFTYRKRECGRWHPVRRHWIRESAWPTRVSWNPGRRASWRSRNGPPAISNKMQQSLLLYPIVFIFLDCRLQSLYKSHGHYCDSVRKGKVSQPTETSTKKKFQFHS